MQGLLEKVPELVTGAGWGWGEDGIDRADSSYTFVPFRMVRVGRESQLILQSSGGDRRIRI